MPIIAVFCHDDAINSAVFSSNDAEVLTILDDDTTKLWEIHPLWNSQKYRNGKLSLQELATVLLILKNKDFVKSDSYVRDIVEEVLNRIDDPVDGAEIVPDEQRHIKNFFLEFLNS